MAGSDSSGRMWALTGWPAGSHRSIRKSRTVGAAEARRFDTRDELRGVLDAYHAKALATGLAEDLPLDRLYTLARDELYGAPCDVAEADRLVAEYRQALRPSSEGPQ